MRFLTFLELAVPVCAAALGLLVLLRRRGLIRGDRRTYLPHLVFLFVIATATMASRGEASALPALTVYAGVALLWLLGVIVSARL